ncbi:MAG: hypothetical protein ACE5WD_06590 [Candidatus Aminicenantia bacterium]
MTQKGAVPIKITFVIILTLFFGILYGSSVSEEPLPILVTAMVHIDPLPTVSNTKIILKEYARHRDGWLWYLNLAQKTGLRISAQMTGVYAETCILQGNASDFKLCMPGGPHHLGTHLHANIKGNQPYVWQTIPKEQYNDPLMVSQVFEDNLPWINRIFEENGFSSYDNWFFHGSHAHYQGMDEDLFDYNHQTYSYDNRFVMVGARRGRLYLYRGAWMGEPHETQGNYIKVSEIGGIIGEDREHGPEGMVYGTVPYQRRDFLRVYIEWREMVRRGDSGPVRHFNWMIHPYQLAKGYIASDGRSPRVSIEELIQWLLDNFIGKKDESEYIMAQFANIAEIRQAFETWEKEHPAEAQALQEALERNDPPRYLPAILDRMETTYHEGLLNVENPNLVVHQLRDRNNGHPLYLVWSQSSELIPLGEVLPGRYIVYYGDGRTEILDGVDIVIGMEPILLEKVKSISHKR